MESYNLTELEIIKDVIIEYKKSLKTGNDYALISINFSGRPYVMRLLPSNEQAEIVRMYCEDTELAGSFLDDVEKSAENPFDKKK